MLYGIDTAQRSSRTNLPDKTKYKPWNGQPMEGSLELQWQGRPVTIQRTGSDRAPMREFSAFDSETGNAVPLTESTCGQTLIGVERSVYERSGFLSFRCMAISGDHALEARLNALVSSGEESFSYTQVEKRLRDQRNRLRHNRLGLLPQAEEELRQVRQQMETLETLNREYRELEVRREQLAEQEKQLSERLSRLQAGLFPANDSSWRPPVRTGRKRPPFSGRKPTVWLRYPRWKRCRPPRDSWTPRWMVCGSWNPWWICESP